MKIGRNDPCPCGSGKKYKNCCLNSSNLSGEITAETWKKKFLSLTSDIKNQTMVNDIFYSTYHFMKENNWIGACHSISTIQYILLNEIGLSPTLCTGVVMSHETNSRFDHSWIELNNQIYDIAIDNPIEMNYSNCIIANHDIITSKMVSSTYGTGEQLDYEADKIIKSNLSDYLDRYSQEVPISKRPAPLKEGLWGVVINIGKNIGLDLDLEYLRNKYSLVYRVLK